MNILSIFLYICNIKNSMDFTEEPVSVISNKPANQLEQGGFLYELLLSMSHSWV